MRLPLSAFSFLARFGFEIGLALVVATVVLVYRQNERFHRLSGNVSEVSAALARLQTVAAAANELEDSRLRYVATGANADIEKYNAALTTLQREIPRIEDSARLHALIRERALAANSDILLKQRRMSGENLPRVQKDERAARAEVTAVIRGMAAERERLLSDEGRGAGAFGRSLGQILAAGLGLALLFFVVGDQSKRARIRLLTRKDREARNHSILLDSILNSMSEGLVVVDRNGYFTHYNAAAQRMIGTKLRAAASEADAKDMGFFDPESGERLTHKDLPFERALRGHRIDDREILIRNAVHPEGLAVSLSSRSLQGIDGDIDGAMVVFKDVSARKALEAEWINAREAALEASRKKTDFLAAMSHEIRTPMNGVIGMTTLLWDTKMDDEQREYVGTIKRSAESLLMLINDILDHSKIEAGKVTLEKRAFDLRFLMRDVTEMFRPLADEKNVGLVTEIDFDGDLFLSADEGRIRQILVNLMGNAVKFTERGDVFLRLHARARGETRDLRFEVRDSGPGMHENERQSLFQKYFQTGNGKKQGGTGLGLSICKQLVGLMGGEIGVDSAPGRGSTFWFTLQAEACAAAEISAAAPTFEAVFRGHVLIAEDQPVNQRVARKYLEKLGLTVDIASNGQQALEMAGARDYDLIFMDCQMPVMTGYEATRALRRFEGEGRHRTIVALTAEGTSGERSSCFAAGMDDFLTKPLELGKLLAVLQKWLGADENAVDESVLRKLADYVSGDRSLAAALREDFEDSAPKLVRLMRAGGGEAVSEAAHALKSTAAAVGARKLASLCEAAEKATLVDETRIADIEAELARALTELRRKDTWRESSSSTTKKAS